MPYYRSVGQVPRKRHLRTEQPDGAGLYFEELMGANGFAQESALLYHRRSPSAIVAAEPVDHAAPRFTADVPLLPAGTVTGPLHLLHLPCLPARESGTLILHWHFGQIMMIGMVRGVRFWASGHSSTDAGGGATLKPFDNRSEVT